VTMLLRLDVYVTVVSFVYFLLSTEIGLVA